MKKLVLALFISFCAAPFVCFVYLVETFPLESAMGIMGTITAAWIVCASYLVCQSWRAVAPIAIVMLGSVIQMALLYMLIENEKLNWNGCVLLIALFALFVAWVSIQMRRTFNK